MSKYRWEDYTPELVEPRLTEAHWFEEGGASVIFVKLTPYYPFALMQKSVLSVTNAFMDLADQLQYACVYEVDKKRIEALCDETLLSMATPLTYYFIPFSDAVGLTKARGYFNGDASQAYLAVCRETDRYAKQPRACLAMPIYIPTSTTPDQLTLVTTNIGSMVNLDTLKDQTKRYLNNLCIMGEGTQRIIQRMMRNGALDGQHFRAEAEANKPFLTPDILDEIEDFYTSTKVSLIEYQFQLVKQLRRAADAIAHEAGS
ncbi:MAG: hypothetical protein GY833_23140 [Aestuariibacter sp.]|nr:hypothetical protein [Aestuariibacter sp.]